MSGWAQYVESLMADGTCQDAAIAGAVDCPGVWSSVPGLTFSKITLPYNGVLAYKNGVHTGGTSQCSRLHVLFYFIFFGMTVMLALRFLVWL
uniref:Uncharacterized protein n=1 Tax=Eptatretus burgeri TaxID=7764 RepID=A0A8C4Q397_EPTBU